MKMVLKVPKVGEDLKSKSKNKKKSTLSMWSKNNEFGDFLANLASVFVWLCSFRDF